ncbi:uracil-DNA glycosylase family protein [Flammeovirga yaeyamensis]|uniref:Uracil-DNA glycosylase family protein n=1 Tax=Flammeovirga yaeyamensis TaxID=367791 RepID=A0AAX1NCR0_9BACT|nr:uracil-DNA glycosylase family protein [Flammeovirga yaeyamensis]MBB3696816.1 uracil-DNA glycosylase [Flammeovirga yaeyamensis]NMF33481.1 uracil-DNA glycosylase family protein [Flammeovirga yaeyamensis]QWG05245.1 uracil-DNA glycosylase family protein [Flammeovirga yaeyamensis]
MKKLLEDISKCTLCEPHLDLGARPVVEASATSKIVIIGQAPGTKVHKSGVPWDDQSGENLRNWMDIDADTFYDVSKIAIIPMGFCYPGKAKTGDKPPRKECAPKWHQLLLDNMKEVKLTLLIGKYAQDYYLQNKTKKTLTETVKQFHEYLPHHFVLPHPSPRNNIWQAKNPWFKSDVLPALKSEVQRILL